VKPFKESTGNINRHDPPGLAIVAEPSKTQENALFMPQRKLAVVTSHPIQYYAPVFRALAESQSIDLRVFYTWSQAADSQLFDAGFGTAVTWDVPLLSGYAYQFVPNVAANPGTEHFGGFKNPSLCRDIEAWNADAVLVFGWCHHSHLQALRYFKGRIPVLFRGDSTLLDRRSWWRAALRRGFLRWVYSHVDVAIAVGANSRDYFAWCGLPLHRIALAPHSVDTVRFAQDASGDEARAAQWRLELGIDPKAVVFLYAGKFQTVKNPALLLTAFSALPAGAHLVLVGSGEMEAGLKAAAGAKDNVHFVPFQNQSLMPTVYRLGDVFVLPSRSETWGLALNEAMACARALIASSNVGGARDLIQPGTNGWVFPSGDAAGLAGVLQAALDAGRPGLKVMGDAGRARSVHWSTQESARCIAGVVAGI
jgi:glycosyltransferase involved in cell wall biosynthesis